MAYFLWESNRSLESLDTFVHLDGVLLRHPTLTTQNPIQNRLLFGHGRKTTRFLLNTATDWLPWSVTVEWPGGLAAAEPSKNRT